MEGIVNHNTRQIELAKSILESHGYIVTKVDEASNDVSTRLKRKRLMYLMKSGSNASDHIEHLCSRYQTSPGSLDDLSDETIEKVYADLVRKYQEDIEKHGDNNEVPAEAFRVLYLGE